MLVLGAGSVARRGEGVGLSGRSQVRRAHMHHTTPALHSPTRLDDGRSRAAARRQARCVDQASVNSGQTDTRRLTPEGGGRGVQTHHVTAIIICFAGLQGSSSLTHPCIHPSNPLALPPTPVRCQSTAAKYQVSDPAAGTVYGQPSMVHVDTWTRAPLASCTTASGRGRLPDSSSLVTHSFSLIDQSFSRWRRRRQHQHRRQRQRYLQPAEQSAAATAATAATATETPNPQSSFLSEEGLATRCSLGRKRPPRGLSPSGFSCG